MRRTLTATLCAVLLTACGGGTGESSSGAQAGGAQARGGEGDLVAQGEQLYQSMTCAGCHGRDGSGGVAPQLQGLWGSQVELADGTTVTADAAYVEESIRDPQAKVVAGAVGQMPAFDPTPEDMEALLAYLRSLGE